MSATEGTPWHAAYPAPRQANPASMTPGEVLSLLEKADGDDKKPSFVLVDLRRNDHEGGTIHGSINLPAQSLYPSIPTLYRMFWAAGVRIVIWYCGSSRGRGTRAAGWFSDHIADHGDGDMRSVVLQGGIKGWVVAGEQYVRYMDEYDASKWEQNDS